MPSISKCLVLLTLALSAVAANHGHYLSRNPHHDIAAREPVAGLDISPVFGNVQKRSSNSKRCKAKPTSSSSTVAKTSSTHSTTHSTTSHTTKTSTTSSHKETTTSKKAPDVQAEPTTSWTPQYTPPATTKTTTSKSSSSTGSSYSGGVGTYFTQNGVEGACGQVHPDSAVICALDTPTYANGAHCGDTIMVTNTKNGKTVAVTVADECPSCTGPSSVDFSEGAFFALGGTVDEGEFPITWYFA